MQPVAALCMRAHAQAGAAREPVYRAPPARLPQEGTMQQKLRLTALILGWYVLNTMYNIGNKLVLTAFPSERRWSPNPNPTPTPSPTPNPSPSPTPNPSPSPTPNPNPTQCRGRRPRGSSSSASRTSSSCGPPACARPLSSAGRVSSSSRPLASSSQALEPYLLAWLHLLWQHLLWLHLLWLHSLWLHSLWLHSRWLHSLWHPPYRHARGRRHLLRSRRDLVHARAQSHRARLVGPHLGRRLP